MFIVQKNEASNKTIRMSNTLIEQLEEIAANEDISFNQLVVQCCEYALANLPKNDGKIFSFDINSVRWVKNYPLGRFLYTSKYRKNNFLVFIKKFFKNFFPHPDKCTHPFGICVKGKQELCLLPTGGEEGELLWSNPLFKMSRQSDISLILCASWH